MKTLLSLVVLLSFSLPAAASTPLCDFVYPANGRIAPVPAGTAAGHGIDIAGPDGQRIIASRYGVASDHVIGSGVNLVIVAHSSGYRTYYRGRLRFAGRGAVGRGTVIAYQGTSTLHFEIRRFGAALSVPGKPGSGVTRGAAIPYDYPGIDKVQEFGTYGSRTWSDFATAVLARLGAPATKDNLSMFFGMFIAEGTAARFNPGASTIRESGSTSFNSAGVQNYRSFADGVKAAAYTLIQGAKAFGYDKIIKDLRAGADVRTTATDWDNSAWAGGGHTYRKYAAEAFLHFNDYKDRKLPGA